MLEKMNYANGQQVYKNDDNKLTRRLVGFLYA